MGIAITMVKLVVALALGIYLSKKRIISQDMSSRLSSIVINYTTPALIISSVSNLESSERGPVLILLFTGIGIYTVLPFFAHLMARVIGAPTVFRNIYTCMFLFANGMFMGFPVLEALFGKGAIFYATILHFPFNILVYSLGLYLMTKGSGEKRKLEWKKFINNGMIASILVIIIFFTKIQLPEIIIQPLSFIGDITMPLAMILIGCNITRYDLKSIFGHYRMYFAVIVRLVVIPVLIYLLMNVITDNQEFIGVATVTFGMPTATVIAMFPTATKDQGIVAAVGVMITTMFSFITIPIMTYFLGL